MMTLDLCSLSLLQEVHYICLLSSANLATQVLVKVVVEDRWNPLARSPVGKVLKAVEQLGWELCVG